MSMRTYTFLELGEECLNAAINLYLRGEYVPAIVLACAAEDHFGGPHEDANPATDPRAHKQEARDFDSVYEGLWGEPHPKPWDAVKHVKNRSKHYSAEPLRIDPEDEAFWAISRAMDNYQLGSGAQHPRCLEVQSKHHAQLMQQS